MEYEFIEHLGGMAVRVFVVTIQQRQTHFHNDIELFVPLEGSIFVDVRSHRNRVRQGDFFIVNRNEAHSLTRTDAPNTLLVMQFSPHFCASFYPKLLRIDFRQHHVMPEWMPRLHHALKQSFFHILESLQEPKEGYEFLLMSGLNRLAHALIRHGIYEVRDALRLVNEERDRARLNHIVDYIQHNYMTHLSLSELSQKVKLEQTYLSHFIKRQLGISFREYVNRLRLERAVELVLTTNLRVIDICMECGYSDSRYLNQAFLQNFGMSPLKYREQSATPNPTLLPALHESDQHYLKLEDVYDRIVHALSTDGAAPDAAAPETTAAFFQHK